MGQLKAEARLVNRVAARVGACLAVPTSVDSGMILNLG